MERTTLEVIALTVEDAIAQGLAQLGMSADDVEVEVLDSGGKGLFGIGGRQARVRLTVKDLSARSGLEETGTASATVGEGEDHLLAYARQTVLELVTKMKVDARVTARYGEPDVDGNASVYIDVRGDDLSVLIGRRSETLNALQYIAGLIVSKEAERWVQLTVDVEGYRSRRERQLRQLAHRMAEQAVKTGRRQVLEPMSAAERRIIHLELRDNPDVTTESIGEEPARKVTILPKEN
jgi:spoIIIJ-associated protein